MKKESQFASAVNRVFFHNGKGFHEIFFVLEIFHIAVGIQVVVRKQMLHQHAANIEPYLGPGVVGIGIIVVVGAGVENVGGSGSQGHLPVVKVHMAPPADDVFEDIMVAVGAQNMIIGIRKGDARGQRGKLRGVRPQIKIIFLPGCSIDIRHAVTSS